MPRLIEPVSPSLWSVVRAWSNRNISAAALLFFQGLCVLLAESRAW